MRKLNKLSLPKPYLVISVLLVVATAYLLGWSNIFVVKKITITTQDAQVTKEINAKLDEPPAVVSLGQPLARVDRREIASRLRELVWVDNVSLNRKILTGEVEITVIPRNPIARLVSSSSADAPNVGFMAKNLDIFYLPRQVVQKAIASGETNWGDIPVLNFAGEYQGDAKSTPSELRGEVKDFIEKLDAKGYGVKEIEVRSPTEIRSSIKRDGRNLDIYWGSVKELSLKIEVMERLLTLPENKRVTEMNLANPVAPIVK